jgi:hypothetical protein
MKSVSGNEKINKLFESSKDDIERQGSSITRHSVYTQ